MDILINFDIKADIVNRGLLSGRLEGKDYSVIISTARLASVDLEKGMVVADLLGHGEAVYAVGLPHPDIKINRIDVVANPIRVEQNQQEG